MNNKSMIFVEYDNSIIFCYSNYQTVIKLFNNINNIFLKTYLFYFISKYIFKNINVLTCIVHVKKSKP